MKNSVSYSIIALAMMLALSCKSDKKASTDQAASSDPKEIIHYNIKIVSDLSNRLDNDLYPRQLNDKEIIHEVLVVFPNLLDNYNRLALQKDKISYGLLNPLEIQDFNEYSDDLSIDLGEFGTNQNKRIEYLKNRNEPTLNQSIEKFEKTVSAIYDRALDRKDFYTADTWGFFKQVVDENYFSLTNPTNSIKAKDVARNVIVLLTDGFIEAADRNNYHSCLEKTCDLLNVHQINKFRNYYNSLEGEPSLKEAFDKSGFGMKPVNNPNLDNVEVLILEVNGRSKTKSGRLLETPTDFEILKLFWEDFLNKEGVNRVAVKNVQPSTDKISLIVQEFLAE